MKVGDLVRIRRKAWLIYDRKDQVGIVVRTGDGCTGTLILWQDGVSLFGRPDFLEVINGSR